MGIADDSTQFPTGGTAREGLGDLENGRLFPGTATHDPVELRSRRYSPDDRRFPTIRLCAVGEQRVQVVVTMVGYLPLGLHLGFSILMYLKNNTIQNKALQRVTMLVLSICVGLLVWVLVIRIARLPAFILPGPIIVWKRFIQVVLDGTLLEHSLITLVEVLAGMAAGICAAVLMGYMLAKSVRIERVVSPYIIASQAVPIVAIAPLLVIWFGSGLLSKVLICALIVFFPVLINTIVGLRSVPTDLRDLMRSLQATRWQTLRLLELPAATPILLGGLRIGATLSVIGAVVGEFAGSDRGLGFLITLGRGLFDTPLVFVAIFTLITMALSLYGIVVLLEIRLLSWQIGPEA